MTREVIFAGEDVLAYGRAGDPAAPLVITFGALPNTDQPDQHGFGDKFLHARHFNAIHVVPLKKQWYQTAEMAALIPLLRERRAAFARCVTYGSSMGAYAALLFGARLDVDAVIAMAPQISIDPKKAGFDRRWFNIGRHLQFIDDDAVGESRAAREVHIFFDPFERIDRQHALAFARPGARLYRIPFAGHQVAGTLASTAGLPDLASDLIVGRLDWPGYRRRLRQRRPQAIAYWRGMFLATLDAPRHARFARFALGRLIGTGAVQPPLLCALAREAIRRRHWDLALTAISHAAAKNGDSRMLTSLLARLGGRVPARDIAAVYATLKGWKAPPPTWAIKPIGTYLRLRHSIGF